MLDRDTIASLLLEPTLLGASGRVNGGANIFPSLYVRLYDAVQPGDMETVRKLHRQLMLASYHLYRNGTTVTAGIKFALAEMGIGTGRVAPPQYNLRDTEKDTMRSFW